MARRNPTDRALGPYRDVRRKPHYRVVIVPAEVVGSRGRETFSFPFTGPADEAAARAEAEQFIVDFNSRAKLNAGVTVEEALLAYERDHVKALTGGTIRTNLFRLRAFFRGSLSAPVSAIDLPHCERLFAELAARQAPDTALNTLSVARKFLTYCVRQRWIRANPLDGWRPEPESIGQRNPGGKGMKQLSFDHLAIWERKAFDLAEAGDRGAAASLIAFKLSLRASKIVDRQAKHVDMNGALLRVPRTGPQNRKKRHPELIPVEDERLRPVLASLAHGLAPDDWLFPAERRRVTGHRDRYWVAQQVKRICRAAGVPEDTHAHGMRGVSMSLELIDGRTLATIQQQAGHDHGSAVTEGSYITAEAIARARQRKLLKALKGGKKHDP